MRVGCCLTKRSHAEKHAPWWQLAEPAQNMVLLTVVAVAVDPVVVVDQPCCCDADIKQIYTRPRPHSTRPDATHEHAREREREGLDTPRMQRDYSATRTLNLRVTRATLDQRTTIPQASFTTKPRLLCFVCFCGCTVTAPCVTARCLRIAQLANAGYNLGVHPWL